MAWRRWIERQSYKFVQRNRFGLAIIASLSHKHTSQCALPSCLCTAASHLEHPIHSIHPAHTHARDVQIPRHGDSSNIWNMMLKHFSSSPNVVIIIIFSFARRLNWRQLPVSHPLSLNLMGMWFEIRGRVYFHSHVFWKRVFPICRIRWLYSVHIPRSRALTHRTVAVCSIRLKEIPLRAIFYPELSTNDASGGCFSVFLFQWLSALTVSLSSHGIALFFHIILLWWRLLLFAGGSVGISSAQWSWTKKCIVCERVHIAQCGTVIISNTWTTDMSFTNAPTICGATSIFTVRDWNICDLYVS